MASLPLWLNENLRGYMNSLNLSNFQRVEEATLEFEYAKYINSKSPLEIGGRKIINFAKKYTEYADQVDSVSHGFPFALIYAKDFVDKYYEECLKKTKIDVSEEEFYFYVIWKTFQNKLFQVHYENGEKKKEPREHPFIFSTDDSVKGLVNIALSSNSKYRASGRTQQTMKEIEPEINKVKQSLKNDVSILVQSLCSKFSLGFLSEQEMIEEVTTVLNDKINDGLKSLQTNIETLYQEKLDGINLLLPSDDLKMLKGNNEN